MDIIIVQRLYIGGCNLRVVSRFHTKMQVQHELFWPRRFPTITVSNGYNDFTFVTRPRNQGVLEELDLFLMCNVVYMTRKPRFCTNHFLVASARHYPFTKTYLFIHFSSKLSNFQYNKNYTILCCL